VQALATEGTAAQERVCHMDALREVVELQNGLIEHSVIVEGRSDLILKEIGYDFDPFHEAIEDHQSEHDSSVQLAPRGWGKSTIGTIGSALVEILRNRNIRILIASDVVTHAKNFLDELKNALEHPRVEEIFGRVKGDVWNEDEIVVSGRTIGRKEKTVMVTGVDGSITSAHFDVIYADDLVTLKNSRTEGGRFKTRQWFYTTLMPCITDSSTKFRVLGTRYHPDDLYNDLMTRDPKFRNHVQIVPALNPLTGESNNPDRFPTNELLELQESMGHIYFAAQFLQDASSVRGSIFNEKHFRRIEDFPRDLIKFSGVDLAIGEEADSAKFAIVTIGISRQTLKIYLLDYHTARLTLKQQDDMILQHYNNHEPVAVGIEANAFQKSKVQSLEGKEETSHVPAIPIYTDQDKLTRGEKLAVRYERGEIIHHNSNKQDQFEEQLLSFPDAKLKDLVDAIDIAIRTAFRKRKKKKRKKEPGLMRPGRSRFRGKR
jgi:predicted phage terminase large subunit-like protein